METPAVAQTVDRRVIAGPAQARALLAAVRAVSDRGAHLEAFYACLYYAALRPSEAVMLRESDCHLPGRRWAASTWPPPRPAPAATGPTTAPPARPGA